MIDFIDTYKEKLALRHPTMKKALELLDESMGNIMVETGCIRALEDWGAGMSTFIFGKYAKLNGKTLYSVDDNLENVEIAQQATADLDIKFAVSDSVKFLENFASKINFLYLDSMDCPEYDDMYSPRLLAAQAHQLKEIETAWPKLGPHAIILLDDNDFENGGKCKFSKLFLANHGCKEIDCGTKQQSLWQI